MLKHHRTGLDECRFPETLRVEEVDLPVEGKSAAAGTEGHQGVVRFGRLIRGFHHARHQRGAVAAGGEFLADGTGQRLGDLGERRVHLLLLGGVLREGDQRRRPAGPAMVHRGGARHDQLVCLYLGNRADRLSGPNVDRLVLLVEEEPVVVLKFEVVCFEGLRVGISGVDGVLGHWGHLSLGLIPLIADQPLESHNTLTNSEE